MTTTNVYDELLDRAAWLANLKPGDEVAVFLGWRGWGWSHVPSILKVDNVTPTLIRVRGGEGGGILEFRRKDGRRRGPSDSGREIKQVTAEHRERVRLCDAVNEFEQLVEKSKARKWEGLTAGQIEQLVALLKGFPS